MVEPVAAEDTRIATGPAVDVHLTPDTEVSRPDGPQRRLSNEVPSREPDAAAASGADVTDLGQQWRVLEASRGWIPVRLADLWRYRELLYFLAWRDIRVRYRQTAIGASWAVLKPLLTMLIFAVVFGHFAKVPSEGRPYPIFSFVALLPWTFFSAAVAQSSNSLVGNANLISKVYFPRLIIPIAVSLAALIDLAIASVVLACMMFFYRIGPTPALLLLPAFVGLALVCVLGVSVWLSALSVQYRDVAHVVPFMTQLWLFATPVAYPASIIHGKLQLAFWLNPMAGVIEGFRWAVLGTGRLDLRSLGISAGVAVLVLASGLIHFRRMERRFADVI